jgi:hypothetical protein
MESKQPADIALDRGEGEPRPDPTPRWSSSTPYENLKSGQIRLLRVQPSSVPSETILKCILTTHDLSTAPPFTALSYTWGSPLRDIDNARLTPRSRTCQIECSDNKAKVGENLYDFLALCKHDVSHDLHGHLWIDALSINQGDIQERSEQVKVMGDIYQKATRVVIWLGPEDQSTQKATKLMNEWNKLDSEKRKSFHPSQVTVGHQNKFLDSDSWQALARFFQREWFNRAWM